MNKDTVTISEARHLYLIGEPQNGLELLKIVESKEYPLNLEAMDAIAMWKHIFYLKLGIEEDAFVNMVDDKITNIENRKEQLISTAIYMKKVLDINQVLYPHGYILEPQLNISSDCGIVHSVRIIDAQIQRDNFFYNADTLRYVKIEELTENTAIEILENIKSGKYKLMEWEC